MASADNTYGGVGGGAVRVCLDQRLQRSDTQAVAEVLASSPVDPLESETVVSFGSGPNRGGRGPSRHLLQRRLTRSRGPTEADEDGCAVIRPWTHTPPSRRATTADPSGRLCVRMYRCSDRFGKCSRAAKASNASSNVWGGRGRQSTDPASRDSTRNRRSAALWASGGMGRHVTRTPHNPKVVGSNPTPATKLNLLRAGPKGRLSSFRALVDYMSTVRSVPSSLRSHAGGPAFGKIRGRSTPSSIKPSSGRGRRSEEDVEHGGGLKDEVVGPASDLIQNTEFDEAGDGAIGRLRVHTMRAQGAPTIPSAPPCVTAARTAR